MKLHALRAAEAGARLLRQAGLGRVVDRLTPSIAGSLERQAIAYDGIEIECANMGHVAYMRDIVDAGHDTYFRELLVEALPSGGTMIDGGAHLGFMSIVAARAVGPSGRVHAFEPNPNTMPILRRNLERNGVDDRVVIHEQGLSDAPGAASFYLTTGGNTSSLHAAFEADAVETQVDLTAGDDVIGPDETIHAIKIDVEGHEVAALRGLRATIERSREQVVLFVECNPETLAAAGHAPEDLIREITGLGLSCGWIDEATRSIRPVDPRMLTEGYVNLLCRRP